MTNSYNSNQHDGYICILLNTSKPCDLEIPEDETSCRL